MTEEQNKEFRKDLTELMDKYNVKNAAICGEQENLFIAHFIGKEVLLMQAWETTINIGRLWQFARETTKKNLDAFDKQNHGNEW